MKIIDGKLHVSATDLATFSSCHHATALDLGVARGERSKSGWFNPMAAALRDRGIEHERRYIDSLRARGLTVVDLSAEKGDKGFEATCAAMRAGAQVIVQATLHRSPWTGVVDVLLRCDKPSSLGKFSYVPVDTKLAAETRAGTVLQLSLYAELLKDVQGELPDEFGVVVPAAEPEFFSEERLRTGDFDAYLRWIQRQMSGAVAEPTIKIESGNYPEPVEHCNVCQWWEGCDKRRRADDHLSLVAGATRLHRRELEQHDVTTLAQLAQVPLPLPWKPNRGSRASIERVREQARVQLEGRTKNTPVHELLPVESGQGLMRLPEPSPNDVFFDIEGDAFAANGGREYLFGLAYNDSSGKPTYEALWATTPAEERAVFERVVRFFDQRRSADSGFHVYHYAPYEPGALKRLMGRYASCEDEVDQLLRGDKFVDLFRITRQSVRASVERYSLKDLESIYGFSREMDLRVASQSRRIVEKAIEAGEWTAVSDETRLSVEAYNREDCVSARALRDWLEKLRAQLESGGSTIPRPAPKDEAPPPEVTAKVAAVRALMDRLLQGVPDDASVRTADHKARWLLAQELEFHRRELKPEYWDFHRLRQLDDEELRDDRRALFGLKFQERLPRAKNKRTETDRYEFPVQDCDIDEDDRLKLPGEGKDFGEVVDIDRSKRTIDIRKSKEQTENHPNAVFEHSIVNNDTLADSLARFGQWVVERGFADGGPYRAACELLLQCPPRLRTGKFSANAGEKPLDFACRIVGELDGTVLPIQGPPGAGKTHTAAHMICALVCAGKKVGITAHSHKVVHNLLNKVIEVARTVNAPVRCLAKVKEVDDSAPFEQTKNNEAAFAALAKGEANVVGGTAWFWAREEATQVIDVLFVDEAGQVSLADALAVAPAANSLVLVGDPRQLDQPLKGAHPDGTAVSALEHLFGNHETVPEDRGIFLAETWRLCPSICEFTSKSFYEDRLRPRAGLERQHIAGVGEFDGAGLWYVPTLHDGNQSSSAEEVIAVAELLQRLLQTGASWIDADGKTHPLQPEDILIVAPYNAQVSLLAETLSGRGIRVGTVDKFQGQEAPIVIYSMATSTPEEAPRGMGFLYSLNRLNVATSRARCACILVASPRLFEPECRNVEHVRLANAFCRYLELARSVQL